MLVSIRLLFSPSPFQPTLVISSHNSVLSQGDYDVVINDYEKAKSLFGNTEVPVFKKGEPVLPQLLKIIHFQYYNLSCFIPEWSPTTKDLQKDQIHLPFINLCCDFLCVSVVYTEVEMRIGSLRSLLLEKLLETPSTLHDQKRYIRSLHACALSVNVIGNNLHTSLLVINLVFSEALQCMLVPGRI